MNMKSTTNTDLGSLEVFSTINIYGIEILGL